MQLQPTDALLCIANLPQLYTQQQFEELVRPFGNLERCFLVYSEKTGHSKGYGFVEYMKKDSAARAKSDLLGKQLGTRTLYVHWTDVNQLTLDLLHSKCLCVDKLPPQLCRPRGAAAGLLHCLRPGFLPGDGGILGGTGSAFPGVRHSLSSQGGRRPKESGTPQCAATSYWCLRICQLSLVLPLRSQVFWHPSVLLAGLRSGWAAERLRGPGVRVGGDGRDGSAGYGWFAARWESRSSLLLCSWPSRPQHVGRPDSRAGDGEACVCAASSSSSSSPRSLPSP